jgi:hypothetical protein
MDFIVIFWKLPSVFLLHLIRRREGGEGRAAKPVSGTLYAILRDEFFQVRALAARISAVCFWPPVARPMVLGLLHLILLNCSIKQGKRRQNVHRIHRISLAEVHTGVIQPGVANGANQGVVRFLPGFRATYTPTWPPRCSSSATPGITSCGNRSPA